MMIKRRVALVLVGQAGYFDIAQLKLPNQTFEDYQPVVEESLATDAVPEGRRYVVRRYFQLIRPRARTP